MSRWAKDPEEAADQLIGRALAALNLEGRVLVASPDGAGSLRCELQRRGIGCKVWARRVGERQDAAAGAQPWPPSGPFDAVLLRLPKSKDEQEMAISASISVLAAAGRLILYGGNAEGIRSAAGLLKRSCAELATLATKGHGRVIAALPAHRAPTRASLAAWRQTTTLSISGVVCTWVSYPGVFAAGRIDAATALLAEAMPDLSAGMRALDFGCGSGVIAASALAHRSSLRLDMLDHDAVALTAAAENVPAGRPILGRRLADTGATLYDAILSNPPLHRGIAEDHGVLHALVADAPKHLERGGVLQIVLPRKVALEGRLARHFASVTLAAQNASFRVWRAAAPKAKAFLPPPGLRG